MRTITYLKIVLHLTWFLKMTMHWSHTGTASRLKGLDTTRFFNPSPIVILKKIYFWRRMMSGCLQSIVMIAIGCLNPWSLMSD